jgi:hypothetical protein
MPNTRLGPDDTKSIVRYLEGQSAKSSHVASTTKTGETQTIEKKSLAN